MTDYSCPSQVCVTVRLVDSLTVHAPPHWLFPAVRLYGGGY